MSFRMKWRRARRAVVAKQETMVAVVAMVVGVESRDDGGAKTAGT